jgi:acetyl-CoA carboxylase biotin carboxylase subunit
LIQEYRDKFANPYIAAERGFIDEVIEPRTTRLRLITARQLLKTNATRIPKKHGNIHFRTKYTMKRIFVANRGEIAVDHSRCRELGITAVIGYSDADRRSLAVRLADEAYRIGPAPSSESYLNIPRLMEMIAETHCDAVHPGYGFLAERAGFAAECEKAGVTFIGPRSEIIDLMGDKTRRAGDPQVRNAGSSGNDGTANRPRSGARIRRRIRLSGHDQSGGRRRRQGNGWREIILSWKTDSMAQSEAQAAFGDSSVYIEKKIEHPHHVEVQVLGDHFGNVIHLGERECSSRDVTRK